jgi:hypothetical protein
MNPHTAWPGNATTPKENPMTAPDPLTRRELAVILRHERGTVKRFLAVEVAPLRERIARIEKRLYMEPEPDIFATYAEQQAVAFDAGPEETP